jgi:hypothetical protein
VTSPDWRAVWVREKCEVAKALSRGAAGGTYSDATILVCAALSALSAEVWPGCSIDRKRFVELLVRLGPSAATWTSISIPLLVDHLRASGDQAHSMILARALLDFSPTRVVTGLDVDRGEVEVLAHCPSLDRKTIREHSYACLLYEDVRSSYAHEYRPGSRADSWAMTQCADQAVSYVNRLLRPGILETGRFIHFHIECLAQMAGDLASSIDAAASTIPRPRPTCWWLDGAP